MANEKETKEYSVDGMTCQGCVNTVRQALQQVEGVDDVQVSLDEAAASVQFAGDAHSIEDLAQDLPSKYQLSEAKSEAANKTKKEHQPSQTADPSANLNSKQPDDDKDLLETYWPLLTVTLYIIGGTVVTMAAAAEWNSMFAMRIFMGLFFVAFSFFKLLDLRGFADAYRSYDIVARAWPGYGFIYPFIELGLGIAYLLAVAPLWVNSVTLLVMGVSIVGVIRAVVSKTQIRCACLGTGFNLPMSQVTIIEDGTMILMAATMIVLYSMG